MSRNKPYQNRLEELFSSTEPVPPEPAKLALPPAVEPDLPGDLPEASAVQVTYTDMPGVLDRQLSRVIEIGRALAQEQNLAALLDRAVNLTADHFGLYSARVYLCETQMERLVLRAASGAWASCFASRVIPAH